MPQSAFTAGSHRIHGTRGRLHCQAQQKQQRRRSSSIPQLGRQTGATEAQPVRRSTSRRSHRKKEKKKKQTERKKSKAAQEPQTTSRGCREDVAATTTTGGFFGGRDQLFVTQVAGGTNIVFPHTGSFGVHDRKTGEKQRARSEQGTGEACCAHDRAAKSTQTRMRGRGSWQRE